MTSDESAQGPFRQRARRVVRPEGPPTQPLAIRGQQSRLTAEEERQMLDRILRALRRKGLPYLFQQVIGAALATVVGLAALSATDRFGWSPTLLPPSLIVASGVVVLLAGLSLVGSAEDAIAGYPLTEAAPAAEDAEPGHLGVRHHAAARRARGTRS